ncbi:MAG: thiamine pyrophosphate-dependent enzyme [Proteocatella sp.]
MSKTILTGNQAIARGFYEAGGQIATSYPGSPTVEILESIKQYPQIYSEFSINEKVAVEVAIGSSMNGSRSMTSMKHVGVNVAMDPLMTFVQTNINGGFLLVTGDDPGMASSQNEQDNRILGKFANMAIFDPSNAQEAKDFVKLALEISEKYHMASMMRITSRLCHSRGTVELFERTELPIKGFSNKISDNAMIPPYTFPAQFKMQDSLKALAHDLESYNINILEENSYSDIMVITSGISYQNLKELDSNVNIFKLGILNPLPMDKIRELSKKYKIVVIEELTGFIENEIKSNGISCVGKEFFSFTGELFSEDIAIGLNKLGVSGLSRFVNSKDMDSNPNTEPSECVPRGPLFCSGCPHRPVFDILKKNKSIVLGDIGCYSMAMYYPFEVAKTVISMGACVGMIKGMRKSMNMAGEKEALVAVIGDGTFFHSGMTGFANLKNQLDENDNVTILILDNSTTAMTGGQDNAGFIKSRSNEVNISIEKLLNVFGYQPIVIDQFKYKDAKQIIDDEIKKTGLSIIIATRPCALKFKIKQPYFYVDPDICIGCRTCVKTNCPPIRMKSYEGIEKLKSYIDPDMCVGCSICSQVCPVGAIKNSKDQD